MVRDPSAILTIATNLMSAQKNKTLSKLNTYLYHREMTRSESEKEYAREISEQKRQRARELKVQASKDKLDEARRKREDAAQERKIKSADERNARNAEKLRKHK